VWGAGFRVENVGSRVEGGKRRVEGKGLKM
jgi:hypothetical protein